MIAFKTLFLYLVFPGFLFAASVGMLAGWVDRKLSARIQYRVGPPWNQNFLDIIKLFGKEVVVPTGKALTFLAAPAFSLIAASLVAAMLGEAIRTREVSFSFDLIIAVYLLIIPPISLIIGAFSSQNPLASVGGSREMKMVLAYELPFILSIVTVIIKTGYLRIADILNYQILNGSIATSISGSIASLVALLCIQAKLGFVPFDAAEAEQELMCGTLIEYSGVLLALFKLSHFVLLFALPIFLIILFFSGTLSIYSIIVKYLLILVAIILIKNTNPRLRIDQALKFFWKFLTPLAALGVVLAILGK